MAALPGAGPGAEPRPGAGAPLLAHLDWWWARVELGLNWIVGLAILGLMFVGVAQISGRAVRDLGEAIDPSLDIGFSVHGYIDWIETFAVLYAILAVSWCQRAGSHIRMEVVLSLLRGRALWIAEAVAVALGLIIVVMLIDATWFDFLRAWSKGDSTMDIRLPRWPAKLMVPIALSTLAVRLALQLAGYTRMIANPRGVAIAVPLVESAREAAKREIQDALGRVQADAPRSTGA
jgi:C4-dicarboxylate transporter DctQ subunit